MIGLVVIALLACSPTTDEAVSSTDEALSLGRTVSLPVTVDDIGGPALLELRAVRNGLPSLRPLTTAAIETTQLTVSLPVLAPLRDRDRTNLSAPVAYRVAMRTNNAGLPGPYTGVSDAALAYFHGTPDVQLYAGAARGWNVVYGIDTDMPEFQPVSNGVALSPNLVGEDTVTVSGSADVPWGPTTHVAVQSRVGDSLFTVADSPSVRDWTITMDTLLPASALFEGRGLRGAYLEVVAYEDADGNGAPSELEPSLGAACLDGREVVISYFDPPTTFEGAIALADAGGMSGYSAVFFGEDGLERIDPAHLGDLMITDACEVPTQNTP